MKFRKKPLIIEAEKFDPDNVPVYVTIFKGESLGSTLLNYYIKTLEGCIEIKKGDWIITGIAGEHYPCKPEIFEKTYDKVITEKVTLQDVSELIERCIKEDVSIETLLMFIEDCYQFCLNKNKEKI